jgi:hypothetical protein
VVRLSPSVPPAHRSVQLGHGRVEPREHLVVRDLSSDRERDRRLLNPIRHCDRRWRGLVEQQAVHTFVAAAPCSLESSDFGGIPEPRDGS